MILTKIIFWINGFFFLIPGETKVTIIWRKMMFHPGIKFSTRGQLTGMKFYPRMKYLFFFACNRNLFFVLKTVARWHEISTRLRNNNFIPGWNLPYNQPLKTLQVSYKFPKVYRYDDILSFFPPRRLKPRINFCSQICINMKQILTKKCPAGKASKNRSETLHEV